MQNTLGIKHETFKLEPGMSVFVSASGSGDVFYFFFIDILYIRNPVAY